MLKNIAGDIVILKSIHCLSVIKNSWESYILSGNPMEEEQVL